LCMWCKFAKIVLKVRAFLVSKKVSKRGQAPAASFCRAGGLGRRGRSQSPFLSTGRQAQSRGCPACCGRSQSAFLNCTVKKRNGQRPTPEEAAVVQEGSRVVPGHGKRRENNQLTVTAVICFKEILFGYG